MSKERILSLAESGGLTLHPQATRIEPFLRQLLEAFSARAAPVGATLTLAAVPHDLRGSFDPDRLAQVLSNLLDNALRHAGPVLIEIGAEAEAQGVRLWVRDHGPGLEPATLERLFERFYRGDPARVRGAASGDAARDSGGSGLGLAIARALIEAHGGTLEAANHPAGGAVFTMRLPTLRAE